MLYRPIIAGQASGSLGGTVFSHNRGGQYTRQRVTPVDPDTSEQQALRVSWSELAATWRDDLSQAQRDAWAIFADQNRYPNRIGTERKITGRGEFFRANLVKLQVGHWLGDALALVFDPPALGPHGPPDTTFVVSIGSAPSAEFDLAWQSDGVWSHEDANCLVWYISDAQQPTINYFRGPYTLRSDNFPSYSGSNNVTIPSMAPLLAAHRYFWRARITYKDGRLSTPWTGVLTA